MADNGVGGLSGGKKEAMMITVEEDDRSSSSSGSYTKSTHDYVYILVVACLQGGREVQRRGGCWGGE